MPACPGCPGKRLLNGCSSSSSSSSSSIVGRLCLLLSLFVLLYNAAQLLPVLFLAEVLFLLPFVCLFVNRITQTVVGGYS